MGLDVRGFVVGIIIWLYTKVFRKEAGPVTRNFMRNVVYVFIGLFVAKLLSLFFQIYVGRSIGAAEYGKYSFVFSVSQFLWVPMLMGVGMATVKYLSSERDDRERKKIVSTGTSIVIMFSLLFSAVFYLLADALSVLVAADRIYVLASILVAFTFSVWTFSQKLLQGLDRMKAIGVLNVAYSAVIVVASFLLLTVYRTSVAPVIAICIGYLISSLVALPEMRRFFRPCIDRKWARILLGYGSIAFLAIFSSSISGNINQLLLNMFLDFGSIGVYQAYYLSTIGVVTFFVNIIVTVFFPESSRYENKSVIFGQMRKLFIVSPVVYLTVCAASFVIITLYGSGYPMMPDLILEFALATVTVFLYTIYNVFSASFGVTGIKVTTASLVIISAIAITSSWTLIPVMGIHGAVASLIVSNTAGLVAIYVMIKRFLIPAGR